MIEARGLNHSFGGTRVLGDVSFVVHPGEVVGFLGPNGAGKTTTMRCLLGILRADAGAVSLTRPVGYLPEQAALYDGLTVRGHLRFMARMAAADPSDIDRVAETFAVGDLLRRPISRLSRGQRQRVALAAALLGSPKTLVLDEPTQALDPAQVVSARHAVTGAARSGAAVLLSTHLIAEAVAVCDRVVVLVGGRIVADEARADNKFAALEDRFLRLVAGAALP